MTRQNREDIEIATKNAFKDAQIYGTGIILVSIDINRLKVKSVKYEELKNLVQQYEENIIKELG